MPLKALFSGSLFRRFVTPSLCFISLILSFVMTASLNAQAPVLSVGQPTFYDTNLANEGINVDVKTYQTSTITRITLSVTTSNSISSYGVPLFYIPFHVIAGSDVEQLVPIRVTHSGSITTDLPQLLLKPYVQPNDPSPYNMSFSVRSDGPFNSNAFVVGFGMETVSGPPISTVTVDIGMGSSVASIVGPGNGKLDFDGDGKSDYTVWRPFDGNWFLMPSGETNLTSFLQWGLTFDVPVPGDYDGDGRTDYAVWRPSDGTWYVIPSSNPTAPYAQPWGLFGDTPVPGDYDGDGKTDFAVWRPWNGTWYVILSSNPNTPVIRQWGLPHDIPVPGDYDGDGKMDYAVWRPGNGTWFVVPSTDPANPVAQQWGLPGDVPMPGDYDGDRRIDYAVWRPVNGSWYVIPSRSPTSPVVTQWGLPGDHPVFGDFDGDGKADYAIWRTGNNNWFVLPSSNPTVPLVQQWGQLGDIPN